LSRRTFKLNFSQKSKSDARRKLRQASLFLANKNSISEFFLFGDRRRSVNRGETKTKTIEKIFINQVFINLIIHRPERGETPKKNKI
jgi:hypothetical protein